MVKRFLAGVAVLALIGASAASAQQGPRVKRTPGMGRVANYLDLTESQRSQMKAILEDAAAQTKQARETVRETQQAIRELVRSGDPQLDAKLNDLAAREAGAMQQLIVVRGQTSAKVFSILAPEQKEKAKKLRELLGGRMGQLKGRRAGALGPAVL